MITEYIIFCYHFVHALSYLVLILILKVALPTPFIFLKSLKHLIGEVSRYRIIEFAVDSPIP